MVKDAMSGSKGITSRIPYLDGLRAFSILAVLLDHVFLHALPDNSPAIVQFLAFGQLGVRIFFVISGFLITLLLLKEYDEHGAISIRGFYERRIARIFPAFYLYIAVILLGTLTHVLNIDRSAFFAASTFTWNFVHFWRHGAEVSHDFDLLGQFWTLSVEEQFYLFWPGCLILLGRRWAMRLAVAGIVLMPLLRFAAFHVLHHNSFQSSIMYRFVQDELFWGVLLAFAVHNGLLDRLRNATVFRITAPWIAGILLFAICPLLETPHVPQAMNSYLTPTLQGIATVILIAWLLSGTGGVLRSLLETWPAVQLGLLSYSLYLWQQIFTLWQPIYWIPVLLRVAMALVVSILCYRLWELPMRKQIRKWFHQARLERA
jgi:peptidoglycan/LPS O-acetylase OafA/YrhL